MSNSEKKVSGKTLLIFPFNLMSHYLRCIQLASYYKEYEILFASSAKYNGYVIEAGYNTFDVDGFNPETVMDCSRKFDFSWLNRKDIETVLLSQIEAINKYKPDLVIGDTSPTLKMAAEMQGVKYIALMNGYMSKYYAETRVLSRTHPGHVHLKKLPAGLASKIIRIAEYFSFRLVHKPFKQLRRKYNLKHTANYLNEMEGDENLICDDAALFPQKNLPKNYIVIGPLFYEAQTVENDIQILPDFNKKNICICMGSSGSWEDLSFLSKPKYYHLNIITAGDTKRVIKGDHVTASDFLNLDKLLPVCSYLICHGGNGTIYKGLKHKIFMLCLTSHFEQEWNVQMLERTGLGRSINDNPEKLLGNYLNVF